MRLPNTGIKRQLRDHLQCLATDLPLIGVQLRSAVIVPPGFVANVAAFSPSVEIAKETISRILEK